MKQEFIRLHSSGEEVGSQLVVYCKYCWRAVWGPSEYRHDASRVCDIALVACSRALGFLVLTDFMIFPVTCVDKGEKVVDLYGGYADINARIPYTHNTLVPVFSSCKNTVCCV